MTSGNGIVVGVDGSPESEAAVDWAAAEAVLHKVGLTLVHVLPGTTVHTLYEMSVADDLKERAAQRGREFLSRATMIAAQVATGAESIPIREQVCEGNPVSAMVDLSRDAQMLVVGSRGLGRIGRALLGSVSSGVLDHAECPVAVIHPKAQPQMQSERAPVVVGIDGSPASEAAVAIAFDEASRRAVELIAVHAWNDVTVYAYPAEEWTTFRPQAEEVLSERLAGWQERYPDVPVRREVVRDSPAQQLLVQAETAQLVVVGSHGRGGFTGMLLGSVSRTVAQSARTAVIVARPQSPVHPT